MILATSSFLLYGDSRVITFLYQFVESGVTLLAERPRRAAASAAISGILVLLSWSGSCMMNQKASYVHYSPDQYSMRNCLSKPDQRPGKTGYLTVRPCDRPSIFECLLNGVLGDE